MLWDINSVPGHYHLVIPPLLRAWHESWLTIVSHVLHRFAWHKSCQVLNPRLMLCFPKPNIVWCSGICQRSYALVWGCIYKIMTFEGLGLNKPINQIKQNKIKTVMYPNTISPTWSQISTPAGLLHKISLLTAMTKMTGGMPFTNTSKLNQYPI